MKIKIEIEDGITSVVEESGPAVNRKVVKINDVIDAFQARSTFTSPLLPGDSGLMKYAKNNRRGVYALVTPPTKTKAFYHDEEDDYTISYNIITPYLLWIISTEMDTDIDKLQMYNSFVYALKGPILTDETPVYRAPFANVYDEGRICWDGVNVQFNQERSLQSIFTQFFSGESNNDLNNDRFDSFTFSDNDSEAFLANHLLIEEDQRLERGEGFDDMNNLYQEILKPQGSPANFKQAFEMLKEDII